jgi:plasmid maintenance system killer protein
MEVRGKGFYYEYQSPVQVTYANRRLERSCASQPMRARKWGPENARRLGSRLQELKAAETLDDMRTLPQARAHELRGDRKGQISLDLSHPYRLIVIPADANSATRPDGGLDWSKVEAVVVLEVTDTHG